MRALPINQTAEFKTLLTNSALAAGDVVALNTSGLVTKADKSNSLLLNVMGFVMSATAGGAVVSVPVRNQGIMQHAGWNFQAGSPVYLASNGTVTQNISTWPATDYIVELGVAIGVNQIEVNIRRAVANTAAVSNPYAVTAGALYAATVVKANLSVVTPTAGKLAMFSDSSTLASANSLTIPVQAGTIITDASDVSGADYS